MDDLLSSFLSLFFFLACNGNHFNRSLLFTRLPIFRGILTFCWLARMAECHRISNLPLPAKVHSSDWLRVSWLSARTASQAATVFPRSYAMQTHRAVAGPSRQPGWGSRWFSCFERQNCLQNGKKTQVFLVFLPSVCQSSQPGNWARSHKFRWKLRLKKRNIYCTGQHSHQCAHTAQREFDKIWFGCKQHK